MWNIDWHRMWVPAWSPWEVALRAAIVYSAIQIVLRASGRRQLGRYTTYDIVLMLLVSTSMRQTIVGSDASLTSAIVGFGTLAILDYLLSWACFRSERIAGLVQGHARRLMAGGGLNEPELRRTRISPNELTATVRQKGRRSIDEVEDAFLEQSGHISVLFRHR